MKIFVFNVGSSSLKFGVFDMVIEDSRVVKGEFEIFKDGCCTLPSLSSVLFDTHFAGLMVRL